MVYLARYRRGTIKRSCDAGGSGSNAFGGITMTNVEAPLVTG